jgi:uncharacterized membrane protein
MHLDIFLTDFCCYYSLFLQAEINADQINALLTATGNTEVEPFYPIIFSNYLSDTEKLAQLIAAPGAGGGGGGGGGGDAGKFSLVINGHSCC